MSLKFDQNRTRKREVTVFLNLAKNLEGGLKSNKVKKIGTSLVKYSISLPLQSDEDGFSWFWASLSSSIGGVISAPGDELMPSNVSRMSYSSAHSSRSWAYLEKTHPIFLVKYQNSTTKPEKMWENSQICWNKWKRSAGSSPIIRNDESKQKHRTCTVYFVAGAARLAITRSLLMTQ